MKCPICDETEEIIKVVSPHGTTVGQWCVCGTIWREVDYEGAPEDGVEILVLPFSKILTTSDSEVIEDRKKMEGRRKDFLNQLKAGAQVYKP